ncbi:MAG: hypothetical protein ACOCVF_02270 [bacterium]
METILINSGITENHKFHIIYEDESFDIIRDDDYLVAAQNAKDKRKEQDKVHKIVKIVDMTTGERYTEVEKDLKNNK